MALVQDVKILLPKVLKRSGVALIAIHFARLLSTDVIGSVVYDFQARGREEIGAMVGLVGLNLIFEITWSALWAFVLISATRDAIRDEPFDFARALTDLNQLAIESVRSLSAVLWRAPFLILPAVVEVFRLFFVAHVVLIDPLYREGRVDALKRSRQVIRQRWALILLVTIGYLALNLIIETITQSESGPGWFWQAPVSFFISAVLTLALSVVYEIFLVVVYLKGVLNAHVQLEAS